MSSIFRQWKNQLQCVNKRNISQNYLFINNELKDIDNILDKLLNENYLLKIQFNKLEERCQQWINDEQIYLLKRIEKLENENYRLHEMYQNYQIKNEKCIQSITNLIIQILLNQQKLFGQCISSCDEQLTPQEIRKQNIEQHDADQWRKKQQQDKSVTRSISCYLSSNQMDDNRSITNDQYTWLHREQDQKTRNYSSELNNHSSTLATSKSKSSNKSPTSLTNKLYFVLNNEKTPPKSTRTNHHSSGINIIPINDSNIPYRKQQSSTLPMTFNKNQSIQQQTRTTYSNHERLPTQISNHTTTSIPKPSRVSTITIRPSTTNIQPRLPVPSIRNQKKVLSSSTTNKSPHPRYTLSKPTEPFRSISSRSVQTTTNKPSITITKTVTNNTKTRIPIVQQSARVSDLDALITEQQKNNKLKLSNKSTNISSTPIVNNIQRSLFSKDNVKLVQPVRSQELKIFSYHLIPEIQIQTNESFSILTPPSLESITNNKSINNENKNNYLESSSNISGVIRDFSEDSLDEHYHIQKLLKQNASINPTKTDQTYYNDPIEQENIKKKTEDESFLLIDENINPQNSQSLSKTILSSSQKSLVHRLIFPGRLGHLIFYRRILSDSDIYRKICSKDNEICHNVYHLDTTRDYSMDFYMLTTYASDSQLHAWIDCNDDDIVNNICHLDENRFQSNDNDEIKNNYSSDSLIQQEELDWNSELQVFNLSSKKENISNNSSEIHLGELSSTKQVSISSLATDGSTDSSSASWGVPNGNSNQLYSTPLPCDITDQSSDSILREILNHSWTDNISTSNSIQHETGIDQYETDSTSSINPNEFHPDFYYLCPITKTISFSKTDYS